MAKIEFSLSDTPIKCRNFKCFGDTPQGFEQIKPMNIIIGRNNSGKSTLLDLIQFAVTREAIDGRGHKGASPQVLAYPKLTKAVIDTLPRDGQIRDGRQAWNFPPLTWGNNFCKDKRIHCSIRQGNADLLLASLGELTQDDPQSQKQAEWIANACVNQLASPYGNHFFRRILADRDIRPEESTDKLEMGSDGSGVTNVIQRHINADWLDRNLVEVTLRDELNKIYAPDATFTRISARQKNTLPWEIYLDEANKGSIPMSQTGSGLKTVLLVLANLLILPCLKSNPISLENTLFAFEELENNLHPAVQRRLFNYLYDFAEQHKCRFFVTTHSNVVIDLFAGKEDAQILHVTHDGKVAESRTIKEYSDGCDILDDLDVRASDLLQSNAVVWVEGPSDRIYFARWVELWSHGQLIEGVHYQCLPFGGSCNAHFSFDSPELTPEVVNELIATLKFNRNAILLIDSDRRKPDDELKEHTQRLVDEISRGKGYAWVTEGKEVENYIPSVALQKLLNGDALRGPGQYADALTYVARVRQVKTNPQKTVLAREVCEHLDRESLANHLDMAKHLDEVCRLIRQWNRLDDPLAQRQEDATGARAIE